MAGSSRRSTTASGPIAIAGSTASAGGRVQRIQGHAGLPDIRAARGGVDTEAIAVYLYLRRPFRRSSCRRHRANRTRDGSLGCWRIVACLAGDAIRTSNEPVPPRCHGSRGKLSLGSLYSGPPNGLKHGRTMVTSTRITPAHRSEPTFYPTRYTGLPLLAPPSTRDLRY